MIVQVRINRIDERLAQTESKLQSRLKYHFYELWDNDLLQLFSYFTKKTKKLEKNKLNYKFIQHIKKVFINNNINTN